MQLHYLLLIRLLVSVTADLTWIESPADSKSYPHYVGVTVAHNPNCSYPECIFVFGGIGCEKCIYCYNITNDSLIPWGSLTSRLWSRGVSNAAMINDKIYFINNISIITILDINNPSIQDSTSLEKSHAQFSWNNFHGSCIVSHPNYDYYLFSQATWTPSFLIYDINNKTNGGPLQIWGAQLNGQIQRNLASCVVNNYNEDESDGDYYMYVIGGDSIYFERINLDNVIKTYESGGTVSGVKWELINKTGVYLNCDMSNDCKMDFSGEIRKLAVTSYQHYIYIIGGATNTATKSNREIFCLNVKDWQFSYLGNYLYYVETHKAMYVCLYNCNVNYAHARGAAIVTLLDVVLHADFIFLVVLFVTFFIF